MKKLAPPRSSPYLYRSFFIFPILLMPKSAKIPEKDIKMLWGRAAGRCSYPQCQIECIAFVSDTPFIIGEMAHIVAKAPSGPRGIPSCGDNTYDNLILLCPTHS